MNLFAGSHYAIFSKMIKLDETEIKKDVVLYFQNYNVSKACQACLM